MDKKQVEGICVVYVAGPYRAPTEWKTRKNIERSADKAMEVWRLNRDGEARVIPVSPCMNSAFFGGEVPDECYLHGDLALLLRCDAMIVADGWENSRGVRAEIGFAEENGIAVLYSIQELDVWMRGRAAARRAGILGPGREAHAGA